MKIRRGFISNSSSSNFIVNNTYKTVFDLAIAMLEIRNEDYSDWNKKEREQFLTEIPNINKTNKDPDSSIYFSTCNYDTYIKKVLGYYIVTTCNNHPFIHELEGIISPPIEVEEWLDSHGYIKEDSEAWPFDESINSYKFQCNEVFWSPKYNLEFSKYNYSGDYKNAFCNKNGHFQDKMVLASTSKIVCPACHVLELPEIKNRFEILDIRNKDED